MSMDTHLKIIEVLASGIDPATGEVLPNESPYNNPDVIRALFAVVNYINNSSKKQAQTKKTIEQKQSENIENSLPKNAGLPWEEDQKNKLAEQFRTDKSIANLAKIHERTEGAITSALRKLGLIEV